jgi:hypothetical protein
VLDPDRPVFALPKSLFKGLPRRLRPFGLQFSIIFGIQLLFFLPHFVANLINIFLVSHQLVRLSTLPTVFRSLCGQNGYTLLFFGKFLSRMMSNLLYHFFLRVQISLSYKRNGESQ